MLIEFTYFSVFTVVPDKATFGKPESAATLHAAMSSLFFMAIGMWVHKFVIPITWNLLIETILLFAVPFIFNWTYFLNGKKQNALQAKYGHLKKWKLRFIGILCLAFGFFSFVFSGILIGILTRETL